MHSKFPELPIAQMRLMQLPVAVLATVGLYRSFDVTPRDSAASRTRIRMTSVRSACLDLVAGFAMSPELETLGVAPFAMIHESFEATAQVSHSKPLAARLNHVLKP